MAIENKHNIGSAAVDTGRAIPEIVDSSDLTVDVRDAVTPNVLVTGPSAAKAAQVAVDSMVHSEVRHDERARSTTGEDLAGHRVRVLEFDDVPVAVQVHVGDQEPPIAA